MEWWQALVIALLYYLSDSPWPAGMGYWVLQRPVVSGLLVGIVMGDPINGIIIGATINLIYLGHINVGGAQPADMGLAGYLGTAIALSQNISAPAALAIAVPIGLLGSTLWVGRMSISSIFAHWADHFAEKGNIKWVMRMNWLPAQTMMFLVKVPLFFVAAMFGGQLIGAGLASMTGTWAYHALEVLGGMLPAIGIALNLKAILKKDTVAFLLIGFLLVAYFQVDIMAVALFGVTFALIIFFYVKDAKQKPMDFNKAEVETDEKSTSLSKRDLRKAFLTWQFFSHANYNYERMQGTAFAMSMGPIIKKLYKTKEDISAALKRHLTFFNVEPDFGAVIHGVVCSMEEKKSNGALIDDEAINGIKTGLMGPMSGIGDAIVQGIIIPLFVAFGINFAIEGNIIGPFIPLIFIPVILIGITYVMWMRGYRLGNVAVTGLMQSGQLKSIIRAAGVLGCTVMGGLISQFVHLQTTIAFNVGEEAFTLQTDVIDKIMPNLLPFALVIACYFILKKSKKISAVWLMLILAVIAFVGAFFKLL